jgi:hypothetical protein
MFCFYYKWKISEHLDQDQEVSPGLSRHLAKCQSCGNFYHSSRQIASRLSDEKASMLKPLPTPFTASVISAISETDRPDFTPTKRRFIIPAAAVGSLATVLLLTFIWLAAPFRQSPTAGIELPVLASLNKGQQDVQKFINQFETPIQKEARQLKESVESAANYLKACLDFRISTKKTL